MEWVSKVWLINSTLGDDILYYFLFPVCCLISFLLLAFVELRKMGVKLSNRNLERLFWVLYFTGKVRRMRDCKLKLNKHKRQCRRIFMTIFNYRLPKLLFITLLRLKFYFNFKWNLQFILDNIPWNVNVYNCIFSSFEL